MIDLYYWPTPNGHKVSIFLEEAGLPYNMIPVDIGSGAQFAPDFLKISPNNRMPAIVDNNPADGGAPLSVFESGAILLYLAEKTGLFLPSSARGRAAVTQWLMWQMGGVGPMFGQLGHFKNYAPETIPYAIDRYSKEVNRLLGVLDRQLRGRDFVVDEYSVADMAIYPWVSAATVIGAPMDEFRDVQRWLLTLGARPGLQQGMALGKDLRKPMSEEAKKLLFNQTAASVGTKA